MVRTKSGKRDAELFWGILAMCGFCVKGWMMSHKNIDVQRNKTTQMLSSDARTLAPWGSQAGRRGEKEEGGLYLTVIE